MKQSQHVNYMYWPSMHLHVCFEAVAYSNDSSIIKGNTVCVLHVPGCGSVVSPGPLTSDY